MPAYTPPQPEVVYDQGPSPSQKVDTATTASVSRPGLVQRGRALLNRAGNFVRRLNDGRSARAEAYRPISAEDK